MKNFLDPKDCPSTHGLAGYAEGSYWHNNDIVCGLCGFLIKDPRPTGHTIIRPSLIGRLRGEKTKMIPRWPDWIRGRKEQRDVER